MENAKSGKKKVRQDSLSFVPGVGDLVTCETRNHSLMEGRVDKVNSGQLHVLFSDDGTRSWVRSSDVKVVKKVSQAESTDPMQLQQQGSNSRHKESGHDGGSKHATEQSDSNPSENVSELEAQLTYLRQGGIETSERTAALTSRNQELEIELSRLTARNQELEMLLTSKDELEQERIELKGRIGELEQSAKAETSKRAAALKEVFGLKQELRQERLEVSRLTEALSTSAEELEHERVELKEASLNEELPLKEPNGVSNLSSSELETKTNANSSAEPVRRVRESIAFAYDTLDSLNLSQTISEENFRKHEAKAISHGTDTDTDNREDIAKMVIGDIIPNSEAMLNCEAQTLCDIIPVVLILVDDMPCWFGKLQEKFFQAIITRARENYTLAQTLYWLCYSGIRHKKDQKNKFLISSGFENMDMMDAESLMKVMEHVHSMPKDVALELDDDHTGIEKNLYDPFVCGSESSSGSRIKSVKLLKVFNSNAKPLLLSLESCDESVPPRPVIFKVGDDLRKDVQVLQMFRFMNALWDAQKLKSPIGGIPVQAHIYRVMPVGNNCGFIELIPDVRPLTVIGDGDEYDQTLTRSAGDEEKLSKMIATGAASYVAAHMMGVKDRHSDNILITGDGTCFHIDFGHVLGDAVTLDTADFAITANFKKCLGNEWPTFVDACVKAYAVLFVHKEQIIEYARLLFKTFIPEKMVTSFMESRFYNGTDMVTASGNIRRAVEQGPRKFFTKLKNVVHGQAVKYKAPPMNASKIRKYHETRPLVHDGTMDKRGERYNARMRTRFFAMYAKPDDEFDIDELQAVRAERAISSPDEDQTADQIDPLVDMPAYMHQSTSSFKKTLMDTNAILYYFSNQKAHVKMYMESLATFNGYVKLSDVDELKIEIGSNKDSYFLVTGTRTYELHAVEGVTKREKWRKLFRHYVPETCKVSIQSRTGHLQSDCDMISY